MISHSLAHEVSVLEADLCSAFADSTRILILYLLNEKPYSVNEIARELDISQPKTSRHLKVLRQFGLVYTTRQGNTVTYQLADQRLIQALDLLRSVLHDRIQHRADLMKEVKVGQNV